MKHIFLNLKRFDIPADYNGVNRLAPPREWGAYIAAQTGTLLKSYYNSDAEFVQFYPEAHLISALTALGENSAIKVGCQGVFRMDTAKDGNFGAFTTNRTANAMAALGCGYTIIGHCEERNDKADVLAEAGITDSGAVNRIMNREILQAHAAGMKVLYCIGEKSEELDRWQEVLAEQLDVGLNCADMEKIVIGYEPVWSIGPGKTPASKEYITKVAQFVKEKTGGADVVYGGGLKTDNAEMLASIQEISGGLIALTRFTGEIGFYPEEYAEIVRLYLSNR